MLRRAEDLLLDCLASILAGASARAVLAIERYAAAMGPVDGPSEVLITRRRTTPLFAAMVNAAAAHVVEQDDVHNGSVFHPAAVVFPPALAVAQALGRSGRDLLTAAVAGYEVGIRVGEFLGRSHYKIFHTTGTAGTIAAAVTVGRLLNLDAGQMLHALGSAGTQAAGLWEFLRDAADSKQLHTAKPPPTADRRLPGARRLHRRPPHPGGPQGMAAGIARRRSRQAVRPAGHALGAGRNLIQVPRLLPPHASGGGRAETELREHGLSPDDIERVVTHVHQGAIDVLGPVTDPRTVHQSKFSMGTVLALVALQGRAGLAEFDAGLDDERVAAFRQRVVMELDPEVDAAYPQRWIGKVTVHTRDGRQLRSRVDEPKGDPGNTLSRAEIEDKMLRLGRYADAATESELRALIGTVGAWKRRRPWDRCWVEAGVAAQPGTGLGRCGPASHRASPRKD